VMQKETDITKAKNLELDESKKTKAEKQENIAEDSEELSTTSAVLLDDQQYLMELSNMCSDKAKTWDQRTRVRQETLSPDSCDHHYQDHCQRKDAVFYGSLRSAGRPSPNGRGCRKQSRCDGGGRGRG